MPARLHGTCNAAGTLSRDVNPPGPSKLPRGPGGEDGGPRGPPSLGHSCSPVAAPKRPRPGYAWQCSHRTVLHEQRHVHLVSLSQQMPFV